MTNRSVPPGNAQENKGENIQRSLAALEAALTDLNYGMVSLAIHDGRVVQIDVTQKTRLDRR